MYWRSQIPKNSRGWNETDDETNGPRGADKCKNSRGNVVNGLKGVFKVLKLWKYLLAVTLPRGAEMTSEDTWCWDDITCEDSFIDKNSRGEKIPRGN